MNSSASLSASDLWSLFFCGLLAASFILQQWLAARQIRHVAAHRSSVPPAFAAQVPLDAHQRAADYTIAKTRLGMLETAWSMALALGWTLLGGLEQLNLALLRAVGAGLLQELLVLTAFVTINVILELPFALYKTFGIESRFGFNRTSPRLWLADVARSALVSALIGLPVALGFLWLMRETGRSWWLWTWAGWMSLNLLLLWAYPVLIAPLFNRFLPLPDGPLKQGLERLLQRCGYRTSGLFVMDSSRRSGHGNAYFTGFGRTKRVVLYDTLLQQLEPEEVEAVIAHELGHNAHHHILQRLALLAVLSFGGFALLGWLIKQTWFYTGLGVTPNIAWGIDAPSNALALTLFILVLPHVTTLLAPVLSGWSRRQEFEADAFATKCAPAGALERALLKLFRDNASTLTPDPLYARFFYSHPPASERLMRLRAE